MERPLSPLNSAGYTQSMDVANRHPKYPCTSSPGQVGACDFLVENEGCIN